MKNYIDLQEYRYKRTEKELEEFEQRLYGQRDHLYLDLRNFNKDKEDYDKRIRYLERYEGYFRNQERRLLLSSVIAFTLLLLWFIYFWFNGIELGNTIWITSTSILGVLLVTVLIIYFLDKIGLKVYSERIILRALYHLAMSPLYLLRMFIIAVKKMIERFTKKPKINRYKD